MAAATNSTGLSAQPAPAIDRERPILPAGRRRLFGLAVGATALATTATSAATQAEPLERLWQEYQRVDDLHTAASVAHGDAEDLAFKSHPPRPACLYGKRYGTDVLFEMTEANIIHWRDQCTRLRIAAVNFMNANCGSCTHGGPHALRSTPHMASTGLTTRPKRWASSSTRSTTRSSRRRRGHFAVCL